MPNCLQVSADSILHFIHSRPVVPHNGATAITTMNTPNAAACIVNVMVTTCVSQVRCRYARVRLCELQMQSMLSKTKVPTSLQTCTGLTVQMIQSSECVCIFVLCVCVCVCVCVCACVCVCPSRGANTITTISHYNFAACNVNVMFAAVVGPHSLTVQTGSVLRFVNAK